MVLPVERMMATAHLPRLVYSGPPGSSRTWSRWDIASPGMITTGPRSYIYHFFDAAGEPLYFGKAWRPQPRFQKHVHKTWWKQVAHLNLYAVTCESHADELCRSLDRVALFWEMKAIADVRPRYNIAGIPKAPHP